MTSMSPSETRQSPAPRRWPQQLWALAAGLLLAATWGSVVQTQFNLQALTALGVQVPLALRAQTTLQDLASFAPVYGGILLAGWLPALALAGWLARRLPAWRMTLFTSAAALGMVAAVRAVDAAAPMPAFIDATRGGFGLLAMAVGAAAGGWLFARWTRAGR